MPSPNSIWVSPTCNRICLLCIWIHAEIIKLHGGIWIRFHVELALVDQAPREITMFITIIFNYNRWNWFKFSTLTWWSHLVAAPLGLNSMVKRCWLWHGKRRRERCEDDHMYSFPDWCKKKEGIVTFFLNLLFDCERRRNSMGQGKKLMFWNCRGLRRRREMKWFDMFWFRWLRLC